jgi:glycosyltransferase involved in cell wall biosynthesis
MLNYEYPPLGGGASPITRALAESLSAAGHDVDVVTMGFLGLQPFEQHGRVYIHRVPALRRSPFRAITMEMLSYVMAALIRSMVLTRRNHYDIIHAHFIIPTSMVSVPLKLLRGIPTVTTIHGSDIPGYNPDRFKRGHIVLAPMWHWLVRNIDAIISPSHYLGNLLRHSAHAPVDIIPYGFTPPPQGKRPRRKRILAASRLFRRKGTHLLLDALAELDLEGWEIVVAGNGPQLQPLQEQAHRLGLPVEFPGFLQREDLQALYESSEIFVFPSMRDNFPVVLLEAMSAGCAVITSDVSGMPEVVGDSGLLVPPGDTAALRQAVQQLVNDPALCREMGTQAQQRIQRFSWDTILAEHLALYRRVIAST